MLNHKGTENLKTKRLTLRRFREDDAIDMFNNWSSHSEVTKYLSWTPHNNIEISKKLVGFWVNSYKNEKHYNWAIELKESKEVIGNITLLEIDDDAENCEVGYCIGEAFWNRGIMTEALLKVIDFGFNEIGFKRIAARFDVNNIASEKVMKKCNLTYEGTLRKIARNNEGILVDCSYYSILKEEYYNSEDK